MQVLNTVGLHARPAAKFVKLAAQCKSKISVRSVTKESFWQDAKSILSVLILDAESVIAGAQALAEQVLEMESANALGQAVRDSKNQ